MTQHTVPMPSIISRRFELVVGWDCEYVAEDPRFPSKFIGGGPEEVLTPAPMAPNRLLSYQLAWVETRGQRREGQVIFYPRQPGERPTLDDLLALLPFHRRVLMVAHNGLAELAHLRERPKVMAVGKVPITFGWVRTASTQLVQFRDTMLLAAEGAKALSILSETNDHWRKCDLTALLEAEAPLLANDLRTMGKKAISSMDIVLRRAPNLYERYALHDSWATLEYFLRFQAAAEGDYGVDRPAVTAVGLSQGAFIAKNPDYKRLWGVDSVVEPDEYGKVRTSATTNVGRAASEALATKCYKGGLNIAYKYGWTTAPKILDVDMVGAYASSMAALKEITWESATPTKSIARFVDALKKGHYGFAHCSFNYPESVKHRHTTLADKSGGAGLVYFRQGTCHATGAEILMAIGQGAQIELHHGVTYETTDRRPFASYLAEVAARRNAAKAAKNKHGDLLAKLVGNGLYGKLGQGLGSRSTSKVTADDESEPIRHSSLTSPQYASYCTAQVRCALAELSNCSFDIGATPLAITTDGGMIAMPEDAGFDELLAAYSATFFGALMVDGRRALLDSGPVLTIKAEGVKALICRTRVNALFDAEGKAVTGAWTGWHGREKDDALRSVQMAAAFDAKDKSLVQWQARLPAPYRIYAKGEEYRAVVTHLTLRVDYDHKRFLRTDGSTSTWTSSADYAECRKLADKIRKHGFAATAENLQKWPRTVPRQSPKSAVAAPKSGLKRRPSPPKETPSGTSKPRAPRSRRTPRKGTVRQA